MRAVKETQGGLLNSYQPNIDGIDQLGTIVENRTFEMNKYLKSVLQKEDGLDFPEIKVSKQSSLLYQGTHYRDYDEYFVEQQNIMRMNSGLDAKKTIENYF